MSDELSGAFWQGNEEEEEEEELEEEEEEEENSDDDDFFGSDSEDETERGPVLSGETKANNAIQDIFDAIQEHTGEELNWIELRKDIDNLNSAVQKHKRVFEKLPCGVPKLYIKAVSLVEKKANALDKKTKNKLPKLESKAHTALIQKLKRENKDYASEIEKYEKMGEEYFQEEIVEEVPESTEPKEETREDVQKKLEKLVSVRGKKGFDRKGQLDKLKELLTHAKDDQQKLEILYNIVGAYFDLTTASTSFSRRTWLECANCIKDIMEMLAEDPNLIIAIRQTESESSEGLVGMFGSPITFVQRLESEYTKHLQDIDQLRKINRYIERLGDVKILLGLIDTVREHYEKAEDLANIVESVMLKLKYIYYLPPHEGDSIEDLTTFVFKQGEEEQRNIACLYKIFWLANHDMFYEARDLLLMSHMQEYVLGTDVKTQILHNRAIAKLGICALRAGLVNEAHSCLSELCSGRVKELLGQGSTRFNDRREYEKLDKRDLVPYHMHINLDLLECFHLISAMLIEVPNMAANAYDVKRRAMSRSLKKYIENFDRNAYLAPPENTRETIVFASKALLRGDWRECHNLISSLKVWSLVPDKDSMLAMLKEKVKEEGLRTYLFSYSNNYDSINQQVLADLFELPVKSVHCIVSKMMINDELHASWDQPTGCAIMHKVEPSRLQSLAIQYTEKISTFVDSNDRLQENYSGNYSYKFESQGTRRGFQKGGRNQGGFSKDNRRDGRDQRGGQRDYQRQGQSGRDKMDKREHTGFRSSGDKSQNRDDRGYGNRDRRQQQKGYNRF